MQEFSVFGLGIFSDSRKASFPGVFHHHILSKKPPQMNENYYGALNTHNEIFGFLSGAVFLTPAVSLTSTVPVSFVLLFLCRVRCLCSLTHGRTFSGPRSLISIQRNELFVPETAVAATARSGKNAPTQRGYLRPIRMMHENSLAAIGWKLPPT